MKRILHNEEAKSKLEHLRENNLIILECIVGSQAYGTNLPTSDIDKKFIYIEPLEDLLSNNITEQLNVTKDYAGYEIGRFCELLSSGNPNILDLLSPPEGTIISISPLYEKYFINKKNYFLTKQSEKSFGEYAFQQIKKAHGTNKKVMNPMSSIRKGLLDFCWVSYGQNSISLKRYLHSQKINNEACGVTNIDHMKNCYHLFVDENYNVFLNEIAKNPDAVNDIFASTNYKGITDKDDVQIKLSSIEKYKKPKTTFYCNIEGFQSYCVEYREYKEWEKNRDPERYLKNIEVGKGYDTKNMSHCHRLLNMCIEIFEKQELNVRRSDEEIKTLLAIRNGEMEFEDLVHLANEKIERIKNLSSLSTLPDKIDRDFLSNILLSIRKEAYHLSL